MELLLFHTSQLQRHILISKNNNNRAALSVRQSVERRFACRTNLCNGVGNLASLGAYKFPYINHVTHFVDFYGFSESVVAFNLAGRIASIPVPSGTCRGHTPPNANHIMNSIRFIFAAPQRIRDAPYILKWDSLASAVCVLRGELARDRHAQGRATARRISVLFAAA